MNNGFRDGARSDEESAAQSVFDVRYFFKNGTHVSELVKNRRHCFN